MTADPALGQTLTATPTPTQMAPPQAAPILQLVSKFQPVYPAIAKQARIGGTVTVMHEIGPDGSVVNARAEGGNPMLTKAATDAARQWRYAPYTNAPGQPLLTTTVDFNIHLTP